MTTILQARPRQFVNTPSIDRVAKRALRYLQSGYSVHLQGPAGVGKTTLALHLADLLSRPIMLLFGDDEFKTSDLIGNQSGFTRKKVYDNFIHSVVKMEDEVRQNWVDSRLTLACREGFTLVYDEFNRSRPEVNNVLLSALEEKLLVLPPNNNRSEYIRVNPHFRAIFTSNPVEYCGVHSTQDALLDRLITINMPEPDELTQHEILVQKTEIDRESAVLIVKLVGRFRSKTAAKDSSGLRSCLMIAKICQEHGIEALPGDADFRELCQDILLSRSSQSIADSTQLLWDMFNAYQRGESFDQTLSSDGHEEAVVVAPQGLLELDHSTFEADDETHADDETYTDSVTEHHVSSHDDDAQSQEDSQFQDDAGLNEAIASPMVEPEAMLNLDSSLEEAEETDDIFTALQDDEKTPEPVAAGDLFPEETLSEDEPDFWQALEVEAPDAEEGSVAIHQAEHSVDLSSPVERALEALSSDEALAKTIDGVMENDQPIANGRISSLTFAPGEEIPGFDAVDQELADKIEAPYESFPPTDILEDEVPHPVLSHDTEPVADEQHENLPEFHVPFEQKVYEYLQSSNDTRPSQIESVLGISRFQTVNALRSLADRGLIALQGSHGHRINPTTQPAMDDQRDDSYHNPHRVVQAPTPTHIPGTSFQSDMTGGDIS